MHPDLVGPACLQLAFHQSHRSQTLHHTVVGHRMLAFAAIGIDLLDTAISHRTPHVTSHRAIFQHISPHQRPIPSVDRSLEELATQVCEGTFRFAQHHQPCRVFVEAMHQPRSRFRAARKAWQPLDVMKHAIHQRARKIAVAGVHNQIHGLVQDQKVVVLVNDVQLHRFWQQLKFKHRLRQLHRHHIRWLDLVVAFDRFSIDPDIARLGRHLKLASGQVGHQIDDEFVHPKGRLTWIRHQPVVLEQLFRVAVFDGAVCRSHCDTQRWIQR